MFNGGVVSISMIIESTQEFVRGFASSWSRAMLPQVGFYDGGISCSCNDYLCFPFNSVGFAARDSLALSYDAAWLREPCKLGSRNA